MKSVISKVVTIALLQYSNTVTLYRGRVISQAPALRSDIVVFIFPALVTIVTYAVVFWTSAFSRASMIANVLLAASCSIGAAVFSMRLGLFIAFNCFGT